MSNGKPLGESVTLRDFVNDLLLVRLPRWAWWGAVVLILLPLAVAL